MDLETCPSCVEPVPPRSQRCPHCGRPIRSPSDLGALGDPPCVVPLAGRRRPPLPKPDGDDAVLFGYFEGEDLHGAMLAGARCDGRTLWPDGLDPAAAGAVCVSSGR